MMEKKRCCESVFSGYHSYRCMKPYSVTRDGKDYCCTHDPEKVKARKEKADKKFEAKQAKRRGDMLEESRRIELANVCKDYGITTAEQLRSLLDAGR